MRTLAPERDIPTASFAGLPDRDAFGLRGPSAAITTADSSAAPTTIKSCAVVSNSGVLKKSGLGSEVDAHDVVFRFNNAPTKGYQKDVGSKTSVRFTNAAFQGFREAGEGAYHTSPPLSQLNLSPVVNPCNSTHSA